MVLSPPPTSPRPHGQPALWTLSSSVWGRTLVEALVFLRDAPQGHFRHPCRRRGVGGQDFCGVFEEDGFAVVGCQVLALQNHSVALRHRDGGYPQDDKAIYETRTINIQPADYFPTVWISNVSPGVTGLYSAGRGYCCVFRSGVFHVSTIIVGQQTHS